MKRQNDENNNPLAKIAKTEEYNDVNIAFFIAVTEGNTEEVKKLIARGAEINTFLKEDEEARGVEPLYAAAIMGNTEIVKRFK